MSSTVANTWFVMASKQSRAYDGEHIDQRHSSVFAEERQGWMNRRIKVSSSSSSSPKVYLRSLFLKGSH